MYQLTHYPKSQSAIENVLAERVGFEPTERFPVHSISSAANSTTLAPLRDCRFLIADCRFVSTGSICTIQSQQIERQLIQYSNGNRQSKIGKRKCFGGEGGIRTHGGR